MTGSLTEQVAESGTEEVAVTESVTEEAAETFAEDVAEEAAETIAEKAAETIAEEVAEKAAETQGAGAKVAADTVAEEMVENVTKEVAETEIVTVKLVDTEEVVKRKGSPLLNSTKHRKFANFTIIFSSHFKIKYISRPNFTHFEQFWPFSSS